MDSCDFMNETNPDLFLDLLCLIISSPVRNNNCRFIRMLIPGARFSKVPKLIGCITGNIILIVSSKQMRLETRYFAIILIFIPFTRYEKTSFTE